MHGIIHEDDLEVYSYSFEILLSTLQSFIVLAILSFITETVLKTVFFLFGFVPLRLIAGGYHAKNHFRCFIILMFVYAAFLFILRFLPDGNTIPVIVSSGLLAILLIFIFAPSEDSNKPISSEEAILFRNRSRLAVACYIVPISVAAVFIADKRYALSLALGVLTVGLSLLANYCKCRNLIRKNKAVRREEVVGNEKTI
jgi:accessory gene regulator B